MRKYNQNLPWQNKKRANNTAWCCEKKEFKRPKHCMTMIQDHQFCWLRVPIIQTFCKPRMSLSLQSSDQYLRPAASHREGAVQNKIRWLFSVFCQNIGNHRFLWPAKKHTVMLQKGRSRKITSNEKSNRSEWETQAPAMAKAFVSTMLTHQRTKHAITKTTVGSTEFLRISACLHQLQTARP